ncbi:MAG: DNA-deoxyinosine glycosylase [Eubacterium sp.]
MLQTGARTFQREDVVHPFGPVYDENSRILILGSFPSVKSREQNFYYGHPQNRFWSVTASVFNAPVPVTVEQKKTFLLSHRIALWDVVESCTIIGSSDASMRDVKVNDIESLLSRTKIRRVFTNGKKAGSLYDKYVKGTTGIEAVCLPSTSPANASYSLERLIESWLVIR